jgi:hypothetical protein
MQAAENTHRFDPKLLAWLREPASYPYPCARVDFVETHISLVALAGDFVYKLKRPIKLSYLDYSTLPLRLQCCHKEVVLNQRLAPGVYLGVAAITRAGDGFAWNGPGAPIEYAVHMRRLPAERMLATLLDRHALHETDFDRLCDVLTRFYRDARRSEEISAQIEPEALQRLVEDNIRDALELPPDLLPRDSTDRIGAVLRQYLHDHRESFARRAQAGAACDGHGDLRAEQIYLLESPTIIDCLEFNDQLRYVDVASDVAFLMNDLSAARQYELALRLVERLELLEPREGFRTALGFYRLLRGWVRVKVAATAAANPSIRPSERERWKQRLESELPEVRFTAFGLAEPKIIALCGLPGAGKSTVAALLHDRLGMLWLRSDVIRKELGLGEPAGGVDLYGDAMTQRTYDVLLKRAKAAVVDRRAVVLDATFGHRIQRQRIAELARRLSVPFKLLECICPEHVLRQRLSHRTVVPDAASDATIRQLQEIRKHFDPVDEFTPEAHLRIDTSAPTDALEHALMKLA